MECLARNPQSTCSSGRLLPSLDRPISTSLPHTIPHHHRPKSQLVMLQRLQAAVVNEHQHTASRALSPMVAHRHEEFLALFQTALVRIRHRFWTKGRLKSTKTRFICIFKRCRNVMLPSRSLAGSEPNMHSFRPNTGHQIPDNSIWTSRAANPALYLGRSHSSLESIPTAAVLAAATMDRPLRSTLVCNSSNGSLILEDRRLNVNSLFMLSIVFSQEM